MDSVAKVVTKQCSTESRTRDVQRSIVVPPCHGATGKCFSGECLTVVLESTWYEKILNVKKIKPVARNLPQGEGGGYA